jgi:hypothetical protein
MPDAWPTAVPIQSIAVTLQTEGLAIVLLTAIIRRQNGKPPLRNHTRKTLAVAAHISANESGRIEHEGAACEQSNSHEHCHPHVDSAVTNIFVLRSEGAISEKRKNHNTCAQGVVLQCCRWGAKDEQHVAAAVRTKDEHHGEASAQDSFRYDDRGDDKSEAAEQDHSNACNGRDAAYVDGPVLHDLIQCDNGRDPFESRNEHQERGQLADQASCAQGERAV